MSKLFNILPVCLAFALLNKELEGAAIPSGNYDVLIVKDLENYKRNHPEVVLQPLQNVEGGGHTLGDQSEGRILLQDQTSLFYPSLSVEQSFKGEYIEEIKITYVELRFKEDVNGGQAYLIGGGLGQNSVSLVLEAPESSGFLTIVVTINGNAASD